MSTNIISAVVDVFITCIICFQLLKSRTGFLRTNRLINLLTTYTITTGLIPTYARPSSLFYKASYPFVIMHKLTSYSLICLGTLIAYYTKNNRTLAVEVFELVVSKAYANTLLANLNSRELLRNRANEAEGALIGSGTVKFGLGTRHSETTVVCGRIECTYKRRRLFTKRVTGRGTSAQRHPPWVSVMEEALTIVMSDCGDCGGRRSNEAGRTDRS